MRYKVNSNSAPKRKTMPAPQGKRRKATPAREGKTGYRQAFTRRPSY